MIGGTWKLQNSTTEIKVDDKFEKLDSISGVNGILFNEISFINEKDFNYSSKGLSHEANGNITSFLGGTGFYKRDSDRLVLEYAGNLKSLHYKLDSTKLTLIEGVYFEEPMILTSENTSDIKVSELRNTFYYKK